MPADAVHDVAQLLDAATRSEGAIPRLAERWDRSPGLVEPAVERWLGAAIAATARHGWRPVDVARAVAANAPAPQAALVTAVVEGRVGAVGAWRRRQRGDSKAAVAHVVHAHALVRRLPSIPFVTEPTTVAAEDDAVLAKVRALLTKAESTTFEAEADALVAKAHQLMVRHAIDAAAVAGGSGPGRSAGGEVVARRVLLAEPYVRPKFTLLACVAEASGCRALLATRFGFATVFGHAADLDSVEVLFTSLLVQATAGVVEARPSVRGRMPRSQVAAYRRAWLLAFAQRVGERLERASQVAVAEAERAHGAPMAPVLAARADAVDAAVRAAAPKVRNLRPRASSGEGWVDGRRAGDRAALAHQPPLVGGRRALDR